MKKIILSVLCNLAYLCVACGQNIVQSNLQNSIQDSLYEQQLKLRVKQVDEFLARFNYEIDHEGKKVENRLDRERRKKQLVSLIDRNYWHKKDSLRRKNISNFMEQVCGDSSKIWLISLYDPNFYAKATCKVKYLGKDETLLLTLKIVRDAKQNVRWVIEAAQAPFLEIVPKDSTKSISPVNHELNFMQLAQITEQDASNIATYTDQNFRANQLSILLYLIKNKQLKIEFVKDISFHFLQIPNYIFIVEHKERTVGNTGWLMTEILQANLHEKELYKQKILYIEMSK
jgi:hypothetical protein